MTVDGLNDIFGGAIKSLFPTIKVKKLDGGARVPTQGSSKAAGYDLYADGLDGEVWAISPGTNRLIKTGIAMAIPDGYFGAIYARSGLSVKQGLRPANCVGIIDSDYRGEIMVPLYNDSDETKIVHAGDRIAQIIFEEYKNYEFEVVDELDDTDRGEGGFGSTGEK